MKKFLKIFFIIIAALIVLYIIAGIVFTQIYHYNRLKNLDLNSKTIVVTESEYVGYLEELYMYPEKYLGREIVTHGYYECFDHNGETLNYVYRTVDMHDGHANEECEEEHKLGFEFFCNGKLPKTGEFIKVTGVLGTIFEDGEEWVVLENATVSVEY